MSAGTRKPPSKTTSSDSSDTASAECESRYACTRFSYASSSASSNSPGVHSNRKWLLWCFGLDALKWIDHIHRMQQQHPCMLDLFLHARILSQAGQVHTQMCSGHRATVCRICSTNSGVGKSHARQVTPSSDGGKTDFRTQRLYDRKLC